MRRRALHFLLVFVLVIVVPLPALADHPSPDGPTGYAYKYSDITRVPNNTSANWRVAWTPPVSTATASSRAESFGSLGLTTAWPVGTGISSSSSGAAAKVIKIAWDHPVTATFQVSTIAAGVELLGVTPPLVDLRQGASRVRATLSVYPVRCWSEGGEHFITRHCSGYNSNVSAHASTLLACPGWTYNTPATTCSFDKTRPLELSADLGHLYHHLYVIAGFEVFTESVGWVNASAQTSGSVEIKSGVPVEEE